MTAATRSEEIAARVTVGIVTALPKELAAMKAMLVDPVEYSASSRRLSEYWLGEIPAKGEGTHAIALVRAGMGNNLASTCATLLRGHFPSIDAILMVGIAGGVPYPEKPDHHVRLGDIVVSGEQGVVQTDFLKQESGKELEHRNPPRPPSPRLLDAVAELEALEFEGVFPWLPHIELARHLKGSRRPPAKADALASGRHPRDPNRIARQPRVFKGPIASANKLLKDATERDRLRDRFAVKAVEMEGSGIADAAWVNEVGYLAVRGICDYCDFNKGDRWQMYAAIIAAAYARAVLEHTPSRQTASLRKAEETANKALPLLHKVHELTALPRSFQPAEEQGMVQRENHTPSTAEAGVKKLWGLASGKCSFPSCAIDCIQFVKQSEPMLVGELAHVIARTPRDASCAASSERNPYENLILLCPTHHSLIDNAPAGRFSGKELLEWKSRHETHILSLLAVPIFSDKGALCSRIHRHLIENKATWKTYGPESDTAKRDPLSNMSRFWTLRKLSQVIPNNRRIINLIEQHKDVFSPGEYESCREFVEHAEGFEASAYDRKDSVPRFPTSFEEIIRNGATSTK